MLSTSDPGGGSCRAMVSDVSMVKYTSMGHSFFSEGTTHTNVSKAVLTCYYVGEKTTVQVSDTHCCTLGHEPGLQTEDRGR